MNIQALFSVRSWNNGMHFMSCYVLMGNIGNSASCNMFAWWAARCSSWPEKYIKFAWLPKINTYEELHTPPLHICASEITRWPCLWYLTWILHRTRQYICVSVCKIPHVYMYVDLMGCYGLTISCEVLNQEYLGLVGYIVWDVIGPWEMRL